MSAEKKIKIMIPFISLFLLLGLLGWELFYSKPSELPSALIGENVPSFNLPTLFFPDIRFTQDALKGKVILLNVWATWCPSCEIEHSMLMKIKNDYHVLIYSLVYKDERQRVIDWLEKNGNPYSLIGDDSKGDAAIDFGVYGTPETFVINRQGKIVYRYIGAIDQRAWDETLYPLIKKLGG